MSPRSTVLVPKNCRGPAIPLQVAVWASDCVQPEPAVSVAPLSLTLMMSPSLSRPVDPVTVIVTLFVSPLAAEKVNAATWQYEHPGSHETLTVDALTPDGQANALATTTSMVMRTRQFTSCGLC